ncbi:hypothetical protein SO802_023215 [Lithocarpus litseifolius]|uniref:Reverse transcriptase zinc-binding domain-containing protein n=1 Tax=Lithocarpus litseifolius TaxID=425828 RepID=A0AAW2C870_9ROSI
MIQSIPLCHPSAEDKLIWPYTPSGQYAVQSGYRFLAKENPNNPRSEDPNQDTGIWKLVWGLSVPNKVKNFLWRASRDVLPTKTNLRKRMILTSEVCDHCKRDPENTIHALWTCSGLNQIWEALPKLNFHQTNSFSNISDLLLFAQREGKNMEELTILLWTIWYRRNQIRVKNTDYLISHIASIAKQTLQDFRRANLMNSLQSQAHSTTQSAGS